MVSRDSDSEPEPAEYRSRRRPIEHIVRCNGIYRRAEDLAPTGDDVVSFAVMLRRDTDESVWGEVEIVGCDDAAPSITFPDLPTTVLSDVESSTQVAFLTSIKGQYYLAIRYQLAAARGFYERVVHKMSKKGGKAHRRRREIAIDAIHDAKCAAKLVEIWFDQEDRPSTPDSIVYAANTLIAIGRLLERLAVRQFEHFVDGARRLAQRGAAGRQSTLAKKHAQIELEKPLYQAAVNHHYSAGASYARAKQIVAREFETTPGIVGARTIHPRHYK